MSSISPYPDGVSGSNPGSGDGENFESPTSQGGYGTGPSSSPGGYQPGGMSSGSAAFSSQPPGGDPGYRPPQPPPQSGYGAPPPPNPGYGQNPYSQPDPYSGHPGPPRDMPMAGASPIRRNIDDTAELPAFLDSAMSDESPNRDRKDPEKRPTRKFPLTTGFTALLRHRHALSVLVRRDLAVKYQSTVMGYLWSLIEPLGLALIYWLIFGLIFGRTGDIPNGAGYALYIIAGIFAWQWFSAGMNQGAGSLGGQSSLITVMKVPREVFPISKVFARFTEYLIGFPILVGVAIFFGGTFGWNQFWLFPAILIEAILLTGIAFILAAANVLYKDVQRFLSLFMRVLFYSSAIIYPLSRVQDALKSQDIEWAYTVFTYLPLVVLFQMHRAVWIPGLAPTWDRIAVAAGFSIMLMFFGRWIFYKLEPQVLKAL